MTDMANPSMTPPLAWLRKRPWGRDVASYARGDTDRVRNDYIDYLIAKGIPMVEALIDHHAFRKHIPSAYSARSRAGIDEDTTRTILSSRAYEIEVADMLCDHVGAGSHVHTIGSRLLERIKAGPATATMRDLLIPHRSIYIGFEDAIGENVDGSALDGFLLTIDPADDVVDYKDVYILPLSRTMPSPEAIMTPYTILRMENEDEDATLEDAIARDAERLRSDAEAYLTGAVVDPDETTIDGEAPKADVRLSEGLKEMYKRQGEELIAAADRIERQAGEWARLIGGAVAAILADDPVGLLAYPDDAPVDLVSRAGSKGTGARKAQQKLTANGYVRTTRHEIGNERMAGEPDRKDAEIVVGNDVEQAREQIHVETSRPVVDARKARRQKRAEEKTARTAISSGTGTGEAPTRLETKAADVVSRNDSTEAPTEPLVMTVPTMLEGAYSPTTHSDELLEELDGTIRKCVKDLPPLESRNWRSAFPPALASMIFRRARVEQAPRETPDATRRRLAADLLPRMEGLPEYQVKLRKEEAANGRLRRAHQITRASVQRPVEDLVIDACAHPFHVKVTDDDELSAMIMFAGVESEPTYGQPVTVVVRAWRHMQTLHLDGIAHAGCMLGLRRLEIDLPSGEITTFDSDADDVDAETFRTALYSCIADAVLGPVDEIDAWQYEPRKPLRQRDTATAATDTVIEAIPAPHEPDATPMFETMRVHGDRRASPIEPALPANDGKGTYSVRTAPWVPGHTAFTLWNNVSSVWDHPPLGEEEITRLDGLLAQNAATRAMIKAFRHAIVIGDRSSGESADQHPRVARAIGRHLSSLAARDGRRIDMLQSPTIDDDADLTGHEEIDGIVVVTDRAIFEHSTGNLIEGGVVQREKPVIILYRLRVGTMSALVVQVDAAGSVGYAQWTHMPLRSTEGEDDLPWYVRGVVSAALRPATAAAPVEPSTALLPAMVGIPSKGTRQGPRRVIAQARIAPANVATAIAVTTAWFDEQVARHGDAVVEDRRDSGEWTIEHTTSDRGVVSNWAVTVRMPDDQPGKLDVIVRTTLATGVKPRLPTLVREIAAATPTMGPDGILELVPTHVRTRSDVVDLIRHLQSPDRVLPTILMSQDRHGMFVKPPADVARQGLGAVNVRTVSRDMTYELEDALGQEYRTFEGAIRLFQPRFDPDNDEALKHPRIMKDSGAERRLSEVISRTTAATVTRYDIPDVFRSTASPAKPVTEPVRPEPVRRVVENVATKTPPSDVESAGETITAPTSDADNPGGQELREEFARLLDASPGEAVVKPREVTPPRAFMPVRKPVARPAPEVRPAEAQDERIASTGADAASQAGVQIPKEARNGPDDAGQGENREKTESAPAAETTPVRDATPEPAQDVAEQRRDASVDAPSLLPPLDLDMLGKRMEEVLDSRLEKLGIGQLLGTVSQLIAKVEALQANPQPAIMPTDAALAERDREIAALQEEMRAERESMSQLLDEAEANRSSAQAQVATLRQAFNDRRRAAYASTGPAWPADLSGLSEWLETNVLPNLVISSKAWREMRRVRYTDMERLCRTLQLLDGAYVDMRAGEDGANARWEEGLKELRLVMKPQTKMGVGARPSDYHFKHEGNVYMMDRHIRGVESVHNEHDRLLRIYFTFDKEERRVLVGHMPTHLTTIDS